MNEQEQPRQHEQEPRSDGPRIYAASLSDYNNGRLHGEWISANQDADEISERIQRMLARSTEPAAEEWAIHDYEGFGPFHLSEYETLDTVARLGQGIAQHGRAFGHWAAHVGTEPEVLDRFDEVYLGKWRSMEDYAEQLLEDLGINPDEVGPDMLRPYLSFNLEAFAEDLSYELHVGTDPDGVHIFEP